MIRNSTHSRRAAAFTLALALCFAAAPAAAVEGATPAPMAAPSPTPHADATMAPPAVWNHRGPDLLFSVALVVASNDGAAASLPAGLQKAVDDVRNFLPYKSYRLVDAGLVRTNFMGVVALNGPGEVKWTAKFSLTEQDQGVQVDKFQLTGNGPNVMDHLTHGSLEGAFRIKKGETVVVGSAALADNSKAIIVLFSAVP